MAEERKISTRMDLSLDEAVKERSELIKYRCSENWVYSVTEKIDRRLADLNNLIAEKVTEVFNHGDTLIAINSETNRKHFTEIRDFLNGLDG